MRTGLALPGTVPVLQLVAAFAESVQAPPAVLSHSSFCDVNGMATGPVAALVAVTL